MDIVADTITLRVIVFKDDGLWVAQCLEYDIGAQADDLDTLSDRLTVCLKAEFAESIARHGKPFAGIDRAPERFERMWDRRPRSVEINSAPWVKALDRPVNLDLAFA